MEREVRSSNLRPVKSDTVLPTARHRCDISSKEAVLAGRNDAEMGPANSLHASAYYSECNERFDFDLAFRYQIFEQNMASQMLNECFKISVSEKNVTIFYLCYVP